MQAIRFRPVAVLLLCLHLVGCMAWKPIQLAPRPFVEQTQPRAVRVTTRDGQQVTINDPWVRDDSILSRPIAGSCVWSPQAGGSTGCVQPTTPAILPLTEVLSLERRGVDTARTVVFIGLITWLAVGLWPKDCYVRQDGWFRGTRTCS